MAGALSLPETQLYLAHNTPHGRKPAVQARYPQPKWEPKGGWKVDPALVFAHTLQESRFQRTVVSSAGATGLMQVRPGTARSEEHTSELQSLMRISYAVFCLKKKKNNT